jgi:MoaA/NifB/PqqE/SkfB family radical SAM enzyme
MSGNQKVFIRLKRYIRKRILLNPTSFFLIFHLIKLTGIIKRGEQLRRKNEKKYNISIPPICILSVNSACNLKCKGCYAMTGSIDETLKINEIEKIIEEAITLGINLIVIAGGEPLLVDDLIKTLSRYSNTIFLVFTNGLLLNNKTIKMFQKYMNIIPVLSYEGSITYNNNRCGEGFGNKIEDALKKLQKSKLIFGFSTMAFRDNINYITSKSYFDKMQKFGASFGFIIDYMPGGQPIEYSILLNDKDLALKKEELENRRKDSNLLICNLPDDEKNICDCWASERLLLHINAKGDVEPCTFYNNSIDNIKQKPLIEILQSKFYEDLKNIANSKSDTKRLCEIKLQTG